MSGWTLKYNSRRSKLQFALFTYFLDLKLDEWQAENHKKIDFSNLTETDLAGISYTGARTFFDTTPLKINFSSMA